MGAGPTIQVLQLQGTQALYRVTIDWGSQSASLDVHEAERALEAADRLVGTFYDIRAGSRVG